MADKSAIEWTDATWNPIRGCSRVSEGCRHCYAEGIAARFSGAGLPYQGLARLVETPAGKEARWTNEIAYAGDETLLQPTRWKRPRRIFVNSMSDLFHENVPDEMIDRVFAVMSLCPQHTFQILTKRPERMKRYVTCLGVARRIYEAACDLTNEYLIKVILIPPGVDEAAAPPGRRVHMDIWPLRNVWLGVSVEDQVTAETRIPYLLQTPAAIRFLSCEPLLGPIDMTDMCDGWKFYNPLSGHRWTDPPDDQPGYSDNLGERIHWVIAGGESGKHARPMHPDWVRSVRDQCRAAGVPFLFKQWGEWADTGPIISASGPLFHQFENGAWVQRYGKKANGRLLDGNAHNEFPEVANG